MRYSRQIGVLLVFFMLCAASASVAGAETDEYNAAAQFAQCEDGVDNDGDGLVDLNDPGCTTPLDDDERNAAECGDGSDNDGDGLADYGQDPDCESAADPSEQPQCSDGVDNDGD